MRPWVVIRIVGVVFAVIAALGLSAAPASAHTISGPRPTNYRSRIVAIAPATAGISARIVDLGAKIEVTNRTAADITVLGYEDEPYLRIGPDGVFENLHSQATYINRTRLGGTVPAGIDTAPTAVPEWKKISSGRTARWHDHRIHWMGAQPPPPVAQDPGREYHISQENIVVHLANGDRVAIAVSLDWVPGPTGLPWIPVIVMLFVLAAAAALVARWWRVLALLLTLIVASDIAHAIAYEVPRPGSNATKLVQFLGGSFVSIAVWIAAVPTVVAIVRRRAEALYGVVFVGLLVALIGGATDLAALWKSQLPGAGPHWLTRLEVVVALAVGGGLVLGALLRMIRTRSPAVDDGRGRWLSLLVAGLSDTELETIVRELDADEVLEVALRELAVRARPVAGAFAPGAVVFVAAHGEATAIWSLTRTDDDTGLRAVPGRVERVAAEIDASFAVLLQLLAGTVRLDDARSRSVVATKGDDALVATLAPFLPETAALTSPGAGQACAS